MDPYKTPESDVVPDTKRNDKKPYRFLSIYSYALSSIHLFLIASNYLYKPIEWVGEWMFVDVIVFTYLGYRFWATKNELLLAIFYSGFVLYSDYSETIPVLYLSFLIINIVLFAVSFGYLKLKIAQN